MFDELYFERLLMIDTLIKDNKINACEALVLNLLNGFENYERENNEDFTFDVFLFQTLNKK